MCFISAYIVAPKERKKENEASNFFWLRWFPKTALSSPDNWVLERSKYFILILIDRQCSARRWIVFYWGSIFLLRLADYSHCLLLFVQILRLCFDFRCLFSILCCCFFCSCNCNVKYLLVIAIPCCFAAFFTCFVFLLCCFGFHPLNTVHKSSR